MLEAIEKPMACCIEEEMEEDKEEEKHEHNVSRLARNRMFLVWLSTEAVAFFHSPSSLFFPAFIFCLVSSIERLSLHGSPN